MLKAPIIHMEKNDTRNKIPSYQPQNVNTVHKTHLYQAKENS